jgi:hypothetical protein
MSESWQETMVALDGTHHAVRGVPIYAGRFEEVLAFHAPGLAPVRDRSGAYHINLSGRPAYEGRFNRTFGFYEERAAVEAEDAARHIDVHGEYIGVQLFSWCGNFQGGRCAVRDKSGRYFHVDPSDRPAYTATWRYVGDFREGLAVVQDDSGRHHHVDDLGRRVGERDFLDLDVFHKGFARARDSDGWFHLRRNGESAYSKRFASVEPFYNGQARCESFDCALVVIDESGREVVRLREAVR